MSRPTITTPTRSANKSAFSAGLRREWDILLFWGIFLLFVGCGLTGSSLGWYRQDPVCNEVLQLDGERRLAGIYRGIRGDEFIAHGTPNALAQANAVPGFPRFNPNIGIGGRDLLVLHDLGAPVKHLSMIGRPACWGFFVLDLRRALAWYWWFPVFLALQFTGLLLREMFRIDRGTAWLLAAGIALAPCSAGWSFWPANNLAGLVIGAWALLRFSRSRSVPAQFGWALAGGWGGCCAALSLYFPRILSLGFVTGGAALAVILTDPERRKTFAQFRTWGIGLAGMLPVLLLLQWKIDCADALSAIASSAYPGIRRMCGGDLALWEVMRGWLAPLTISRSPLANQSESQAPLAFYFALIAWNFCMGKKIRRPALWYTVCGCMIFLLVYQLAGLPERFADLTLWSRANPFRCMMALNLGQFLLLAQVCEQDRAARPPLRSALIAGSAAAAFSFSLLFTAPWSLIRAFAVFYSSRWIPAAALAGSFLVLLSGGVLLLYRPRAAAVLLAGYGILLGMVFNPVCIAPEKVSSRLLECIHQQPALRYGGRVMFATGNDFAAVCHYLGGGRTLNGYFMYPDPALMQLLFAGFPEPQRFARMNHLDAEIAADRGNVFTAELPYNDRIKLSFGPGYDFSRLPVDFLAVPQQQKTLLLPNRSLKLVRESPNLVLFRVRSTGKDDRPPGP